MSVLILIFPVIFTTGLDDWQHIKEKGIFQDVSQVPSLNDWEDGEGSIY